MTREPMGAMTPEQMALADQVDAVYTLPDDAWVDAYLAALESRDGGQPGGEPDDGDLRELDQRAREVVVYELTDEEIQKLLDRLDPPRPVYDWATDPSLVVRVIDEYERDLKRSERCVRGWVILAGIALAVLALVTWGAL